MLSLSGSSMKVSVLSYELVRPLIVGLTQIRTNAITSTASDVGKILHIGLSGGSRVGVIVHKLSTEDLVNVPPEHNAVF
jgi:hypothetical protein